MTVAMAITLIVDVFHRKRTKSDLELVLKNVLIISVRHMVTFLCNTAQPSPATLSTTITLNYGQSGQSGHRPDGGNILST